MNYNKISKSLERYDPLFSHCSLKVNSTTDIKTGLEHLVKAMSLSLRYITDGIEAEAAFLELVTKHFISDKQCRDIGRIPIKLSYQHLSATFMKIHHNAHPAWRYQSQIISSIQKLFSCPEDFYLKILYKIYREICLYVSGCDRYYDTEEIKQFLSATTSILCYYISILEKRAAVKMWNPIQKQKVYKSNHNKLKTLLTYASELIETSWNDPNPIFTFIKILADKITLDSVMDLLTTDHNPKYPRLESYFMEVNHTLSCKYNINHEVYQAFSKNQKNVDVTIDLAKDPILTFPWDHQRLIDSMLGIGTSANPWKEDAMNHAATLYLPVGVTFIHNGLHSIFTGMAKREGAQHISPDSRHQVVDISGLYDLLQFDGTNYLVAGSDVVAGTAMSFEFGCIFEIGRMLHEKGICFKNLLQVENK